MISIKVVVDELRYNRETQKTLVEAVQWDLDYETVGDAFRPICENYLGLNRQLGNPRLLSPIDRIYVFDDRLVNANGKTLEWDDVDDSWDEDELAEARNKRILNSVQMDSTEQIRDLHSQYLVASEVFKNCEVQSFLAEKCSSNLLTLAELRKLLWEDYEHQADCAGTFYLDLPKQLPQHVDQYERTKTLLHWLAIVGEIDEVDWHDRQALKHGGYRNFLDHYAQRLNRFLVTKKMLDLFWGDTLPSANYLINQSGKFPDWPTQVDGDNHVNGRNCRWDYQLVRMAVKNSNYRRKQDLLAKLPESDDEARQLYKKLSNGNAAD